jgi:hypothetical protein
MGESCPKAEARSADGRVPDHGADSSSSGARSGGGGGSRIADSSSCQHLGPIHLTQTYQNRSNCRIEVQNRYSVINADLASEPRRNRGSCTILQHARLTSDPAIRLWLPKTCSSWNRRMPTGDLSTVCRSFASAGTDGVGADVVLSRGSGRATLGTDGVERLRGRDV